MKKLKKLVTIPLEVVALLTISVGVLLYALSSLIDDHKLTFDMYSRFKENLKK